MKKIKPILYERIEQKKEIELELFSKLTPKERAAAAKSWMKLIKYVGEQGALARQQKKSK